jgi:membrane peptidoglycan carboxypeptidase
MPDDVKIPTTPAMALGSFGASPLDMAQVYATLANHGKQVPYTLVLKVTKDGNDLTLPKREPKQTVPRDTADTVTSVLRSVVEGPKGTARVAQDSDWPSAAKTGTAENDIAAWFAGYTPKLASVVAVLGMNPDTGKQEKLYHALHQDRINGGGPPGQVWADYTAAALRGVPVQDFDLDVSKDLPPTSAASDEPTTDTPTTSQPPTSRPPASTQPPTSSPPTTEPTTPTGPTSEPPTTEPTGEPTQTFDPLGGLTGAATGGPGGGPGGG